MHRLAYLVGLSREEAIATLSSVCVKYSLQQALAFTRYVSPQLYSRTNKQNYQTMFIQYIPKKNIKAYKFGSKFKLSKYIVAINF